MCWCLSIIELKNARWNIEIKKCEIPISLALPLQVQCCHAINPSFTNVITDYSFWSILTPMQCSIRLTCGLLCYLKLGKYTDTWKFSLKAEWFFYECILSPCWLTHLTSLKNWFWWQRSYRIRLQVAYLANSYRRFGGIGGIRRDSKVKVTSILFILWFVSDLPVLTVPTNAHFYYYVFNS